MNYFNDILKDTTDRDFSFCVISMNKIIYLRKSATKTI